MKRIYKKINSIFLFILMLLNCICFAYADEPRMIILSSPNPTISVSSVSAQSGDTVTVDVIISDNPGIFDAGLWITYNQDALQLIDVSDGGLLGGFQSSNDPQNLAQYPYKLAWINTGVESNPNFNYTADGVLATLTFKVLLDAEPDDYYIGISIDDLLKNQNGNLVDVSCSNTPGHVIVNYAQKIEWSTLNNRLSLSTNMKYNGSASIYAAFYDINGKMLGIDSTTIKGNGVHLVSFDDLQISGVTVSNYQTKIKTIKFFTLDNYIPLATVSVF